MIDKLKLIRDVFVKCFIVGFLLFMLSFVLYFLMSDFANGLISSIYSVDQKMVPVLVMSMVGLTKISVMTFFMVPAIALHWTVKILEKQGS